ncbi:MAG: HypC/HybG/HupF family hydrogenase formation chaperone [Halodesulfurarchaeum sp.]
MCLGIPGEVLEVDGEQARAEFWGTEKWVRIDIVGDEIEPGDYVLNHAGFAIRKIPEAEVEETMEYYESLLGAAEGESLVVESYDGITDPAERAETEAELNE